MNIQALLLSHLSIKLATTVKVVPVYDIIQYISGASNNDNDLRVE